MVCLTPLKIGHVFLQPYGRFYNAYRHIAQCVSLALVLVWGVDLAVEDVAPKQYVKKLA